MIAVLMLWAAAAGTDGHRCPMTASAGRQAEVDARHERTTGVPTEGAQHHFLITEDGGRIQLEAVEDGPGEVRDRARVHLRAVARAFAAGDFSMPEAIHGQVPPGAAVLSARAAAVRYAYEDTPRGGALTLATADAEALRAIHAFLRFQIDDHATGDAHP